LLHAREGIVVEEHLEQQRIKEQLVRKICTRKSGIGGGFFQRMGGDLLIERGLLCGATALKCHAWARCSTER